MYDIILSDKAKQQLKKLPSEIKNRISTTIERIKIRPYYFIKRIINSPYFRLRVGDYRIILDIKNSELVILVIGIKNRKNVYK